MKNLFKKLLASCLAVCMVLTLCVGAISVSAEDPAYDGTLAIGTANINKGATEATVPFTATATGTGIAAAEVNVTLPEGCTSVSKVELVTEDDCVEVVFFKDSTGDEPVILPDTNTDEDVYVYEGPVNIIDNVFSYILKTNDDAEATNVDVTVEITFAGTFDTVKEIPVTATVEACQNAIDLINLQVTDGAINVHEHNYVDTVTTPATCTTDGVKTFECECGDTYTETIPATGHDYASVVTDPTCTTAGYTTYTCKNDASHTYVSDEVAALDHAWNAGEVTTAPDCENAGVRTYTCANDPSHTKEEAIDALGHTAAAEKVKKDEVAATCTTAGSYRDVVVCAVCGAEISSDTITVDALGHTPGEPVEENRNEATCALPGSYDEVVNCTVCKAEISRETVEIKPTGEHEYVYSDTGDGQNHTISCKTCNTVSVTEAHNYVDGTCDKCGAVEEVACEHTDANQDGICDNGCGYENLDASLVFFGKAMSLGDDIRGVFQVRNYKKNTFANTYVSFKVIVEKEGVKSELELVAESVKTNYTTYGYAITVAPKEMVDILNARIVGITAEGEAFISNVDTWSIKEGLISNMASASTGELTEVKLNTLKLAANMLNYGAEAQKNFDYKVDNLATDNLPEEYAQYIITETPEMSEIPAADETGVTSTLKGISFNLEAKVEMIVMFKVPKTDAKEIYSAQITQVHTAPDGTVTTNNYTIEGKDCLMSGTTLGVYINNLRSNDLRDVLTITLYKNGNVVSATHTLSAESVAKSKMDANPTLVSALMVYGDCARALFK